MVLNKYVYIYIYIIMYIYIYIYVPPTSLIGASIILHVHRNGIMTPHQLIHQSGWVETQQSVPATQLTQPGSHYHTQHPLELTNLLNGYDDHGQTEDRERWALSLNAWQAGTGPTGPEAQGGKLFGVRKWGMPIFFVAMDDDKGNLGISNVQTSIFLSGSHQKQGANQRDVLFSAHLSVKLPILTAHYCKN